MTKAKIYLCLNYLTSPHNSCIKNEMRVREAEGIFKIEVPDNVRKFVIVKAQVHGSVGNHFFKHSPKWRVD
jgi:hypothetical protein